MATFAYSGRTRAGQNVVGERVAESMDAAVSALRREQILVTQINPVKVKAAKDAKKPRAKGVDSKRLAIFGFQHPTDGKRWIMPGAILEVRIATKALGKRRNQPRAAA